MKTKYVSLSFGALMTLCVVATARTPLSAIPSNAFSAQSHTSRVGLMTTTSFGPFGETTVHSQPIDFDAYVASGSQKLVVGSAVAQNIGSASSSVDCSNTTVDELCYYGGDDPTGGGTGGSGPGGGGSINPGGSGPGASAPSPPDPPVGDSVAWNVGVVTFTQYYDNGNWQQTTTYSRDVYPATQSDGPWGPPVVVDSPVKK